jgi:hypothetical protein
MKTKKAQCGNFTVFHCGNQNWTVEDNHGTVLDRFLNLSEAFAFASSLRGRTIITVPAKHG